MPSIAIPQPGDKVLLEDGRMAEIDAVQMSVSDKIQVHLVVPQDDLGWFPALPGTRAIANE